LISLFADFLVNNVTTTVKYIVYVMTRRKCMLIGFAQCVFFNPEHTQRNFVKLSFIKEISF